MHSCSWRYIFLCVIDDPILIHCCTWAFLFLEVFCVSQMIACLCIIVHGRTFFLKSSVSHRWLCFHASLLTEVHFFIKSSVTHGGFCFSRYLYMNVYFFLKSSVLHRLSCLDTLFYMHVHFSKNLLYLIDYCVLILYRTWKYTFLKNFY